MLSYKMYFCAKQSPLRYLLVTEGCGEVIHSNSIFDKLISLRLPGRMLAYLEMARAIYYFHRYKIAHCNIHPHAFLVRRSEQSHITLGELGFVSSSYSCTESSIQFMAPEVAQSLGSPPKEDEQYLKSDIYSLGLVIADLEAEVKNCPQMKPSIHNSKMVLGKSFDSDYSSMMRSIYVCMDRSWDIKRKFDNDDGNADNYKGNLVKRLKAIIAHMLAIDPAKRPSIQVVAAKFLEIYLLLDKDQMSQKKFQETSEKIRGLIERKGLDHFLLVPFQELKNIKIKAYDSEL